jgi:hypothetical protein
MTTQAQPSDKGLALRCQRCGAMAWVDLPCPVEKLLLRAQAWQAQHDHPSAWLMPPEGES